MRSQGVVLHLLFFYVDKYKDFINIYYVYQVIRKYIRNTNIKIIRGNIVTEM